jgi:hypothetical protein
MAHLKVINTIDGRQGLRGDLRGEIKLMSKGAEEVSRGLELWGAGRSEAARRGGGAAISGSVGRRGMSVTSGAHVSMRRKRQGV